MLLLLPTMTQEREHILFTEIRNGNEVAFNKAFDLYYSRLCFFSDQILHDFDLSRSIVQQVFVDLWIKRDRLLVASLQAYLYHATRNASLDVLKHKKVESRYLSSLESNESIVEADLMEEAELAARINEAIQNLPEKCREVFLLCRFEGLKYAEIADQLNISVKTVEMQISIALKKLRSDLSDYQMIQLLSFFISKKHQLPYRVI